MSESNDTEGAGLAAGMATGRPVIDAEPVTGQIPKIEPDHADEAGDEKSRRERRAEWRREDKARRYAARKSVRFPILTRSVLLWCLLFALTGLAFGASGAFWWANFNSEISDLRTTTDEFEERSTEAQTRIEELRQTALNDIDSALKPLQGFLSETQMLQLAQQFSPSVYSIATLDQEGRPSSGTAFAVISDGRNTYYVTSYASVKAATIAPGPEVTLRKGTEEIRATVHNFDPDRDLALLQTDQTDVPVLDWAADDVGAEALGGRVFPVSGLGGAGASLTTGVIIDQSAVGFQHTAPLGTAFQGGPIVTVDGAVLGVASLAYQPLGFDSGQIHFAVPINQVCQKLVQCGGGAATTPGPAN